MKIIFFKLVIADACGYTGPINDKSIQKILSDLSSNTNEGFSSEKMSSTDSVKQPDKLCDCEKKGILCTCGPNNQTCGPEGCCDLKDGDCDFKDKNCDLTKDKNCV